MTLDYDQLERLSELAKQLDPDLYLGFVALVESEAFHRRFGAAKPFGAVLLDRALKIQQVSARFCSMLGYAEYELLGHTLLSVISPDDVDVASDCVEHFDADSTRPRVVQLRFLCKSKTAHFMRLTFSRSEAGGIASNYLYAVIEDIDELASVSDERTHIIDSANCLLWHAIVREAGFEQYLSWEIAYPPLEAVQRFLPLDIPDGSYYQKEFYKQRPQEDRDRCDAEATRSFRAGRSYKQEFRVRAADGIVHWMQESVRVETIVAGQTWRAVGVCVDITDRKQNELAVRESETRFRALVNDLPILIWMLDSDNRPTLCNRAWLEFTGYPEEKVAGFDWVTAVHPDDADIASKAFAEAYHSRNPYQSEYRMRRHDGEYRWLLSSGLPRFLDDGTFVGYIGSSQDITDLKLLQNQLIESQKLESLGRLAGGVAHDFNNLLTAIMGYTELTLLALHPDSDEYQMLGEAKAAVDRAVNLTRQMLMYARRQMVEFSTLDVNEVIVGSYGLLRRTIGAQYELVTLLTEDKCYVNSNTTQIEQVLFNLVVNARDAMPDGGQIVIETQCVELDTDYASRHHNVIPGQYVMFAISDTGIGMTPEVRDRIFEPFFTTKEIGKGTGLGLATSYGIIKQSRGHIWVYSEPGAGTTFKVYLPLVSPTVAVERPIRQEIERKGTGTILLVDDAPMVRDSTARILRQYGYQVLEAANGEEALHVQSVWIGTIDLLLTDVVMPLMGGRELAQQIQELRPGIRVLYITGYTENAILYSGVLKPGIRLLPKPFTAAALINKVQEALSTL